MSTSPNRHLHNCLDCFVVTVNPQGSYWPSIDVYTAQIGSNSLNSHSIKTIYFYPKTYCYYFVGLQQPPVSPPSPPFSLHFSHFLSPVTPVPNPPLHTSGTKINLLASFQLVTKSDYISHKKSVSDQRYCCNFNYLSTSNFWRKTKLVKNCEKEIS